MQILSLPHLDSDRIASPPIKMMKPSLMHNMHRKARTNALLGGKLPSLTREESAVKKSDGIRKRSSSLGAICRQTWSSDGGYGMSVLDPILDPSKERTSGRHCRLFNASM